MLQLVKPDCLFDEQEDRREAWQQEGIREAVVKEEKELRRWGYLLGYTVCYVIEMVGGVTSSTHPRTCLCFCASV